MSVTRPGTLGKRPFGPGATVSSDVFLDNPQWRDVSIYTKATQAGTVLLYRIDQDGQRHPYPAAIAVAAAPAEDQQTIHGGFGQIQADYTNTSGVAGIVTFEVRASQGA